MALVDIRLDHLCPAPGCDGALRLDEQRGVWTCETCRRMMEIPPPGAQRLTEILAAWTACRSARACNHPSDRHPVGELVMEVQRLRAENERLMAAVHREGMS